MTIEKILFAAADKMRGAMDAGEYKHIALGLPFLRYVSEAFARRHDLIVADGGEPEDRDEYLADTFFVPPLPVSPPLRRNRRTPALA
ncbi:type I restriction-modification system subunit M N-terminal domain-containing protein [Falsirhodobacter deserti]|uniref:type I restriction-modification system subunit M N-terminal domain-containing protein n=1 Tax=Falsirhodobacter deserti TaxID=1365611 RepID=UPI000FE3CD99|nr:type I restriction-modification system subunit M N-terminal domain-containing protein [Falsirhodobacter deserti]